MQESASLPSTRPVFVLGCGRSGTTLMRTMLNRHSSIAIPGETWFFPGLAERKTDIQALAAAGGDWRKSVQEHICGFGTFDEVGVAQSALQAVLAETQSDDWPAVVAAANLAYAMAKGKPRWGDKTPGYVRDLTLLKDLYPDAVVIHMIRDGRDVATSFLAMPFGPASVFDAAVWWTADVQVGRENGPGLFGERYIEVRYEDLVDNPERTLKAVCDVLGEPFEPAMMDQSSASDGQYLDAHWWHQQTDKPLTAGRIGRWRTKLTERDVCLFELEGGALLAALGYELSSRPSAADWLVWRVERLNRFVHRAIGWLRRHTIGQSRSRPA